jgi:cytoplasmic iron level regulating protein YaaA (DUF328/UPF0246 family)
MQFNEKEFNKYRKEHPEERWWQALRNYMGVAFIWLEVEENQLRDTFYIQDEIKVIKKKM